MTWSVAKRAAGDEQLNLGKKIDINILFKCKVKVCRNLWRAVQPQCWRFVPNYWLPQAALDRGAVPNRTFGVKRTRWLDQACLQKRKVSPVTAGKLVIYETKCSLASTEPRGGVGHSQRLQLLDGKWALAEWRPINHYIPARHQYGLSKVLMQRHDTGIVPLKSTLVVSWPAGDLKWSLNYWQALSRHFDGIWVVKSPTPTQCGKRSADQHWIMHVTSGN